MILVWLGMIAFGAATGGLRQVLLLVASYSAIILAGSGYAAAGSALKVIFGDSVSKDILDSYMLLFLFIVIMVLFYRGFISAFPETRPVNRGARQIDTTV